MRHYLYDGSFEGAMTGVYKMFHDRVDEDGATLQTEAAEQMALFDTFEVVTTDFERAERVTKWMGETFEAEGIRRVATAYLSDAPDYGTRLFRALKACHKMKRKDALMNLADPAVMALYDLYRKVVRAEHLMVGLLRFKELENGTFYAYFEPPYNLLPLLMPHFEQRLGDQTWVIHDGLRGQAAFYDGTHSFLNALEPMDDVAFSKQEAMFQELWQGYFKHIAIKERLNPKCQRNFMPKKYWKFLVEKPGEAHRKKGVHL